MPTPTVSRGTPPSASQRSRALHDRRAAATAARSFSAIAIGAPNTAIRPSPLNSTTFPPCSPITPETVVGVVIQGGEDLPRVEAFGDLAVAADVDEEDRDVPASRLQLRAARELLHDGVRDVAAQPLLHRAALLHQRRLVEAAQAGGDALRQARQHGRVGRRIDVSRALAAETDERGEIRALDRHDQHTAERVERRPRERIEPQLTLAMEV